MKRKWKHSFGHCKPDLCPAIGNGSHMLACLKHVSCRRVRWNRQYSSSRYGATYWQFSSKACITKTLSEYIALWKWPGASDPSYCRPRYPLVQWLELAHQWRRFATSADASNVKRLALSNSIPNSLGVPSVTPSGTGGRPRIPRRQA